jgi:hypothetical protein
MIPEGFLRRALKVAHETIEDKTRMSPNDFLNGDDYVYYEDVSGELMSKLALTEQQVDLLLGYLYENVARSSEEYLNMPSFKKPKEQTHEVWIEEVWIARYNRKLHVNAYNPIMAQFLSYEDPGEYEVGQPEEEWVSHEDTEMNYNGIARN